MEGWWKYTFHCLKHPAPPLMIWKGRNFTPWMRLNLHPVQPSKVVCVGLNYRDHAEELNMDLPEEPILFLKPPSTVIGHDDNIIYPHQSHHVDYEA